MRLFTLNTRQISALVFLLNVEVGEADGGGSAMWAVCTAALRTQPAYNRTLMIELKYEPFGRASSRKY
jgi:hypothetical protein